MGMRVTTNGETSCPQAKTPADRWIIIPNWDKFQHYKDREPVWIKVYCELNSRDEWLALTTAERGMLTTIWVEYARSRGRLRVEKVMSLCGKSARSKHLASLNHAGFIELADSPRARRERGTTYPKERAGARAPANGRTPARQEEEIEPPRDPEAITKLREIAAKVAKKP